jgi:hypothetical protein
MKNLNLLDKIENLLYTNENEIHKAISLVKLGMPIQDAFAEVVKVYDVVNGLYLKIDDDMVKEVAGRMILDSYNTFDEKLRQI